MPLLRPLTLAVVGAGLPVTVVGVSAVPFWKGVNVYLVMVLPPLSALWLEPE